MEIRRGYILVYDEIIPEVPMIAVPDRKARRWRKDVRVGQKAAVVVEAARDGDMSIEQATKLVDLVLTNYNHARKERYVYLRSLRQAKQAG